MKGLLIKNGANAFTALRIVCTLIILFVTNHLLDRISDQELFKQFVFLYIVICSSDFFDGKVARKFGIESRLGAIFDLFADFCFVVSMHLVMIIHGIIPAWFIIVILDRFFNFIITSKIENDCTSQRFKPKFDKIGRYIAVSMYIMPFIVSADYCFLGPGLFITKLLVYSITGISIVTSYSRIINLKSAIAAKVKGVKPNKTDI